MKKFILGMLLLLITVTTTQANTSPYNDNLHGGFQPALRGWYNNRFEDFKIDLATAINKNQTGKLFLDPNFVVRLVENAQIETGDNTVTIQDILDEGVAAAAPTGFRQTTTASHEMSVWSKDGTQIEMWGARNSYQGEKFLWFRGKCLMSLYCANLVREIETGVAPVSPEVIPESRDAYIVQTKKQVTPGTTVIVNAYGGNVSNSGNSTVTAPVGGELGGSNVVYREPQGGNGNRGNNGYTQNIRYSEPGIGTRNIGTGIGVGLMGVAAVISSVYQPVQRYQIASYNQNVNSNYNYNHNTGNNNGGNHGGGNNNYNNIPWSGGTDLRSQGPLPANLYNNGTGIRNNVRYSNNAGSRANNRTQNWTPARDNVFVAGMYNN